MGAGLGSNFLIGAGLGGLYSVLLESLMEKHYPAQELVISALLEIIACVSNHMYYSVLLWL